ncbi:WhiB family transcriptional regulator (plasmid) [Streptomyces sp. NEAU-sy36]|uniref:WhiB family transcriptional regulator n=1 Tax=Streptomyces sp. NEAU-H33 TaxID=2979463 RepID=UPI0015D62087|nr:WhiB family transcriptional regulator [Streptomyces sp. NEAU-sy36]
MTATTSHATTTAAPRWEYALCAQTDPDLFFPEGGAKISNAVQQAKQVCGRCPIRRACLSWALETRQPAGIWGGMSEKERRVLLGVRLSQTEVCMEHQEWIEKQIAAGVSQQKIADRLGVAKASLYRALIRFEEERVENAMRAA